MKLWELRPVEDAKEWEPWYDKAFGFVVRAATAQAAREFVAASDQCGGEGNEVWLDPSKSTCDELTLEGEPEVIIMDFARA